MLALPLVLVGCTSDDGKKPTVLPSLAPPAASPSSVPVPSVPPEASAETAQGAAAFARHYMDVLNQAYAAADPTLVQSVSSQECGGCQDLIGVVQALRRDGSRSAGGEYDVKSALAPAVVAGDVIVDIVYERPPGQIVGADGAVVERAGSVGPTSAQMRLLWRNGAWVVQGYRVVGK